MEFYTRATDPQVFDRSLRLLAIVGANCQPFYSSTLSSARTYRHAHAEILLNAAVSGFPAQSPSTSDILIFAILTVVALVSMIHHGYTPGIGVA
jgi:hypothetical protein